MRKKIAFVLCILLCTLSMGCSKGTDPQQTDLSTSIEQTETPDGGKIVTDQTEVQAMAGAIVENMSLEEKIGQMFIVNLEQLDNSHGNYYEFRKFTDKMENTLKKYYIGGVILFARNIENIDQTKNMITELQNHASIPLFVSVDEEGGDVARVGNNSNMRTTTFPPMEEVGKNEDEKYAYNMGKTIASEIKELGFNLDFAPVADVKTNEYNTEIGNRAFGSDAKLVSKFVKQVVKGIQGQGISATLKHFPGHGSTNGDSHKTPVNADTDLLSLRSREFKPFKAGIEEGADFVMVSHISISKVTENTVPASMSNVVMQNMLRDELKFKGIIITDGMDMGAITEKYDADEAAVNCIKAGADIVLMSTDVEAAYDAVKQAVEKGEIDEKSIDESVQRILEVKIKRGIILSNTDLLKER